MRSWLLCGALLIAPIAAFAASGPDQYLTSSGTTVTGSVQETLDGSNVPHPTSPSFPVPVTGASISTPAAITRSNNTTPYGANTGWNNGTPTVFTFPNACATANGGSYIAQIGIFSSANPTVKLQGILWLFSSLPGTLISDDVTFNIAAADFANLTGGTVNGTSFTLASAQASGAPNSGVSLTGTTYHIKCDASKQVYGMVQVVNAYVPAANEVLTVRLSGSGIQ